jgi:hypothetical protein
LRVLERVVAGVTLTAGVVWVVGLLLFGSDAGLPFPALIDLVGGGAAVLVLWAARVALHLAITRYAPERRRARRFVALPLGLLISVAFVSSGAAFRVRFMLSRSLLKDYVQTVSPGITGSSPTPGVRVGLFRLRNAEVLPQGVVRMITTECGVVDSCGLVYSPAGTPPVLGEDVYDSLGGPWYHWYRRF